MLTKYTLQGVGANFILYIYMLLIYKIFDLVDAQKGLPEFINIFHFICYDFFFQYPNNIFEKKKRSFGTN